MSNHGNTDNLFGSFVAFTSYDSTSKDFQFFMNKLFDRVKTAQQKPVKELFRDEEGAIDLASIMVGIIVIGLIGGVIAATVFAVIPWAQDNAAKHQLNSIVQAENAYFGLSAALPSPLPTGSPANSFADSGGLDGAKLLIPGKTYCAVMTDGGKGFAGYSKSASGNLFMVTDKNTSPVKTSGTLPADCSFLTEGTASPSAPYVDPTPALTILTYRCDTATSGVVIPMNGAVGKETWSDGVSRTYAAGNPPISRNLAAGITYTLTFEGTYSQFTHVGQAPLANCLRSMNHWGDGTGVTDASAAFFRASNLTSVPEHIPTTLTDLSAVFSEATIINDPNISKWNVSKATTIAGMFFNAKAFNQPLNSWDTSSVTQMSSLFAGTTNFNQPLNNWNTSSVTKMNGTFQDTAVFNQNLSSWDTSNVVEMFGVFNRAAVFNMPLNNWNTSKVTTMLSMFQDAPKFNQPLNNWNTSSLTNMSGIFANATAFDQPINSWDVSKVTNSFSAFNGATSFNQPLNSWNVAKVTDMRFMFANATSFVQDLRVWSTISVTQGTNFAPASFPAAYLPARTSSQ